VLRTRLKEEYPDVRFYAGGHRAIRVNYIEPIQPGGDNFTADLMFVIRRDEGGRCFRISTTMAGTPRTPDSGIEHLKPLAQRERDVLADACAPNEL
jgi:hypothetical protein